MDPLAIAQLHEPGLFLVFRPEADERSLNGILDIFGIDAEVVEFGANHPFQSPAEDIHPRVELRTSGCSIWLKQRVWGKFCGHGCERSFQKPTSRSVFLTRAAHFVYETQRAVRSPG